MSHLLKKYGNKINKLLGLIVFTFFLVCAFLYLTYLYRGADDDRISVTGIKEEKENSLDVICVGGSTVYAYWEPLKAFNDYGFTSYDLNVSAIPAEGILALIKYAQKYQHPELYVVDVRVFESYDWTGSEAGIRTVADRLDFGMNRAHLIHDYLNNYDLDTDIVSLYIDIAKYHTNREALFKQESWQLTDNSIKCLYKGFRPQTTWRYCEEPMNFQTGQRKELQENSEKVLEELLDYCDVNGLNVLFVVCPYSINAEQYAVHNTIGDIVSERGYNFLNLNDFYDEMDLEFAVDFQDKNHVNVLGADKYTDFLGKYIIENYNMPDHAGEECYDEWKTLTDSFLYACLGWRNTVQGRKLYADQSLELGNDIRETDDFVEWGAWVKDDRYTLAVVGNAISWDLEQMNYSNLKILNQLGLNDIWGRENYIALISDGVSIKNNDDEKTSVEEELYSPHGAVPCIIENTSQECSIIIDGTEYSCRDTNGLNVVVYDINYGSIIDSVSLAFGSEGKIVINR